MVKRFIFSVASLLVSSLSFGSIVINEVMPKNVSFMVDDSLQFSSWAELYNSGAEAVDIANYFFSDTSAISDKWQVVSNEEHPDLTVIQPKGHLVVYFDGTENGTTLHANFKLPAKKGGLYLFDESGRQIDRMVYDTTFRNVSYGRAEDGGKNLVFFLKPSRGASNNGVQSATVQTPKPIFSLAPGFYQGEQEIKISDADASAQIYYTLNGNEPTKEKGMLYNGPIRINKNTPVRAAAYRDGQIPSDVATTTYFVNERNINLPVVSVVADSTYLYDVEIGMLVRGKRNGIIVPTGCSGPDAGRKANYMTDWDRPANFELYDGQKKEQLNQEVKIGNFGACSRTKFVKSLKVNAGKVYGDKQLDYAIFKEKPNLRWKSVVLRNSGNDFGRAYLRDGFMQTVVCCMGVDHQAYQPSVVFLNGKYYGMLNIRERTNKDFIYSNYGYDEDEFYLNVGSHANEGTTYNDVLKLARMTEEELNFDGRYEEINDLIDVDEFLNYFLAEIYSSNTDWPGGNIKAWKPKNGGRWRWILYDTDFGLSLYNENYVNKSIGTAKKNEAFSGFLKNKKIKERFVAKCCVHLATTFQPSRMKAILDSMAKDIDQEARVYERYLSDNGKVEGMYDDNIQTIKRFIDNRIEYIHSDIMKTFSCEQAPISISSDTKGATYLLNEEPIKSNNFEGIFFTKTTCALEAVAPTGYLFDHWEISRNGKTETVYDAMVSDTLCAQSYKAYFKEDASYDPAVNKVLINEVCTKNKVYLDEYRQSEDWIELYNTGKDAVNMAGKYLSCSADTLDMFQFPSDNASATTIPAGGYMIVWADKDPKQGPLHADFKLPFSEARTIILSEKKNGSFSILDSVTYKLHQEHQSYARFVEQGKVFWATTNEVTFAAKNAPMTELPVVVSEDFTIAVYPNPVEDRLSLISSTETPMSVKIISVTGTIVAEETMTSGESINLEHLNKGVYMVFVNSAEGSAIMKIVKK